MRNLIILFFLSFIVFSCASKKNKKKTNIENKTKNLQKEDIFISNKVERSRVFNPYKIGSVNFKKINVKKINKELDFYSNSLSKKDLLSGETLNLFSRVELSRIKKEMRDPIGLSLVLCYQKKYKNGFDKLDKIFFKYKKEARYWNSLAICYFLSGEKRKSDLYLNKALSLDKKFAPSINNLGVLSNQRKLYKRAFDFFNKSSKVNSFSITPILNKAQVLLRFNLIHKACPVFMNLYSEDPLNKDIGHGYGTCLLFNDKPKEAYNVYKNLKIDFYKDEIPFVHYLLSLKLMGKTAEISRLISGSKANFQTKYARRMFDFVRLK